MAFFQAKVQRRGEHHAIKAQQPDGSLREKAAQGNDQEERHLWYDYLRTHPARFTRQKILGKYIADFYSAQAKLVIELDGSQHFETSGMEKDTERTAFLEGYGLKVLRIPNNEIMRNFRGVCEYIDAEIKDRVKGSLVQRELAQPSHGRL